MGPLTSSDVTGAVLLGLGALGLLALVLVGGWLVRSARARRALLAAELASSRAQVESLRSRVEELSAHVERAGHTAAQDREYVITSLAEVERGELRDRRTGPAMQQGRSLGEALENQLVESLARSKDGSGLGSLAVGLVVRSVALGHGVRRALSPENLDRAASEAHVARRRSRRTRKRELREARRLLRVVRTSQQDEDVA